VIPEYIYFELLTKSLHSLLKKYSIVIIASKTWSWDN